MAQSPIDRIVKMLGDPAPERRLAAAIVLGELKPKGATVNAGLAQILTADGPALQRHALEALTRIGVKKGDLESIWPLLASRDPEVRDAAAGAVASVGEAVVPTVRARLATAEGDERRALESVLGRLGGAEAFDALLEALAEGDEETNRATALELRRYVKEADAATRRTYRSRLEKFLKELAKREAPPHAEAAAVKVLGFLEDPKTAPLLLELARDATRPASVRQEALIALRFTMGGGATADVVKALVGACGAADRALAQTALMTLAAMDLPAALAPALAELALHPELDRARIAIDKLGSLGGKEATKTLVDIVARGDKRRAELAAAALEARADAVGPLAELLSTTDEIERARLALKVLRPRVTELTAAHVKALVEASVKRLREGSDAWESALALLSERAPDDIAKRLREEAASQRKARKPDREVRILRALRKTGRASDEDLYRLASIRLSDSKLDPRGRRADRAIEVLTELQRKGFDVINALRADRTVELEQLYYVGFCFLEDRVGGGEELLEEVVRKGGRKKIAAAAKNKLKLAERE